MPPLGWLIGGVNFSNLSVKFPANPLDPDAAQVTWNYGNFIQVILDFVIVAFCIFLLIKGINKLSNLKKKEEAASEAAAPAPEPSDEVKLLTEIRDLLNNKK